MKPLFNRTPLVPNTRAALPLGAIRPEGWLLDQLQAQLRGFTLPYVRQHGAVSDGGGWFGAGEAGRAWLDALEGATALAWTLDDGELKDLLEPSIEWLLADGAEAAFFGPEDDLDVWPRVQALKALRLYFTASSDRRVLARMDAFFREMYLNLDAHPLTDTAVARGGELIELVLWMYNLTGQKHLPALCRKLRPQVLDWANHLHIFPNKAPLGRSVRWDRLKQGMEDELHEGDRLEGEKRPYFQSLYAFTEGVNFAVGLKTPGIVNLFKSGFKEQDGFLFGWPKVQKHHGVASGAFTSDHHLAGTNPTQGVDAQAVAALLDALETLAGLGDYGPDSGERLEDVLEKVAYNALPAVFSPEMDHVQPISQVNQVRVSGEPRRWYNAEDGNLFRPAEDIGGGLHGAWARFTGSLWYATEDGGISAASYAPCTVRFSASGVPAKVTVSGGYPFGPTVRLEIHPKEPVEFPLYLRIPYWARQSMLTLPDGELMQVRSGETVCLRRRWRRGDLIRLELPTQPRLSRWHHQSGAVEYGPLLMAFQPVEDWAQVEGGLGVETGDHWNWAMLPDEPMKASLADGERAHGFGRGEPGVEVLVKAVPVQWPMDGDSAASVPMAPRAASSGQVLELVPFGDTALRIAQFPVCVERPPRQE